MADYRDILSKSNPFALRSYSDSSGKRAIRNSVPVNGTVNGIIFTDTLALSKKFSIARDYVISSINSYIDGCSELGISYILLDMSDTENAAFIAKDRSWLSYHKALHSFVENKGIRTSISTSVFVIGGDDVIAVPHWVFDIGFDENGCRIQIDLWYCFSNGFDVHTYLNTIYQQQKTAPENVERELMSALRFNISRLPLPNGIQELSFDATIGDYFKRVLDCGMSVDANAGIMATAKQWLRESAFVSENLPLLPLSDDERYVYKGIYRSPDANIYDAEFLKPYIETLADADYLLFNLHGDDGKEFTGYYGNENAQGETCTAFDIDLLPYCKASVLNTMACYGARYEGYDMRSSMLLSSIYGSVLSFVGASNIALGCCGRKYPCGCSETLLKMYTERMFAGEGLGEALLKTKIEYLVNFSVIDTFENAYYTICEFNMFGDPLIHCRTINAKAKSFRPIMQPKYEPGFYAYASLDETYERVRNLVDDTLDEITKKLQKLLSLDYGFKDIKFKSAKKNMLGSTIVGYTVSYAYSWGRAGMVSVRTDKNGNPSAIFYTK